MLFHNLRIVAVNVGDKLGGGLIDGLKACTKLFQFLVFRPGCDIAEAVFARCDTIIGAYGKGNTFCLDFFGVSVFLLFVEETLHGNLTADKVQAFVLGQVQAAVFAKVKGLCRNNRTGVIDGYILLDGYRHTGVIVRAAQIIAIQSFGQIIKRNTPIREQSRYIEYLDLLVFWSVFRFLDFLLIMELGMGNLMYHGRDSLHFTHTLTDSDFLLVQREIAV